MLERSRGFPQLMLPKVAADGRAARIAYAAPAPPASNLPRIALLLAGFGQSARDSGTASETLPGPVGFAVSTYAGNPAPLIEAARARGHELFASIPMEPQGYPLNDEGTRSLRTGLTPEENQTNLEWALGQVQGAVGATGASDGMRGERFAELSAAFDPVLDEIGRRGLLYLDPRPGRPAARPGTRAVDLVLDEPPARAEIEAKLASLERIARDRGSAIGLIGPPRPVTLERIASWARGLQARGILLVPISSLIETAHE
ncbi:MAG: divergent polysaccharide deacetylase family protein [Janthinobacterium lividum]